MRNFAKIEVSIFKNLTMIFQKHAKPLMGLFSPICPLMCIQTSYSDFNTPPRCIEVAVASLYTPPKGK